jgi:acetyltransferase-like isoleucine patch superfamily enzyme
MKPLKRPTWSEAASWSLGASRWQRAKTRARFLVGDAILAGYERFTAVAAIGAGSRRARRFARFGQGSVICFPPTALFGEQAIQIGDGVLVGPGVALSAGTMPGQEMLDDAVITIGDGCLIGRGSSISGHLRIEIGNDVYFGPNVFVTDQNHAFDQLDVPIGWTAQPEQPVRIGAGSWLGTNVTVLPGVTIGRHVAVGAGSVVTGDLPDYSVAAGVPARVLRIMEPTTDSPSPDDEPAVQVEVANGRAVNGPAPGHQG